LASPTVASAIVQINGIEAAKFVADLVFTASSSQDPDAGYNTMFYSNAQFAASGSYGLFETGGRLR
jgi:hypothetical protein